MSIKIRESVAVFVVLLPLVAVTYALLVTNGIPLADEWRWFKNLLLPLIEGKIDFWQYIVGEYSFLGHTHFITLFAIYLDYRIFDLNLSYLAYLGLLFFWFGWVLLIKYFFRVNEVVGANGLVGSVVMAIAYSCMTSDFPWVLVSFEYFYYFFAILLLILLDLFLRKKVGFQLILFGAAISALLLDSFGSLVVIVYVSILLIVRLRSAQSVQQPIILFAIYVGTWFVLWLLLGSGIAVASKSRLDTIIALLNSPSDIFLSLLICFSQPLLDKAVIVYFFPDNLRLVQIIIGGAGVLFVLATLFLYLRRASRDDSMLPFILFSYALMAWLLILVTRYLDFGVAVFDSQRFTRFFVLYYVAAGFAMVKITHKDIVFVRYFFPCTMVLLFGVSVFYQYTNLNSVTGYFEGARFELNRNQLDDSELGKYIGKCKNNYCAETIYSLREKGAYFLHGQ